MNRTTALLLVLLLTFSCKGKIEPTIESGIDECENCGMIIDNIDQGAVSIDKAENLHSFCSPVCMLIAKNAFKQRPDFTLSEYYLFDHYTFSPIPVLEAVIVKGNFNTAMGHGLLAFSDRAEAQQFAAEVKGEIVYWRDLRLKFEIPDKEIRLDCADHLYSKVHEVKRGDVVSVCFKNDGTCSVTLKGYDLEFPDKNHSHGCTEFIADKPGQGFVFIDSENNILGSLLVTGEHTTEEKLYQ